jgi:predicted nuclease of predicted toxin-antitoxin system
MPRFLLDANLPPKLARTISREFGIDVASLIALGLGQLSDPDVLEFAHRSDRILITLDRDFSALYQRTASAPVSIVYLRVPNEHRRTPALLAILSRFVSNHLDTLDDGPVFVTVTPETVIAVRENADVNEAI